MWVHAKLPEMYGLFKGIQKDNYPFNHNLEEYLETISTLGLKMNLSVTKLVGYIENTLLKDERLPDIPEGNEPVEFRVRTSSLAIEEFYKKQNMTNKAVTLLILRMTLRLSVRFGTSLQRLRYQIENITKDVPSAPIVVDPYEEALEQSAPPVIQAPVQATEPKMDAPAPEQTEPLETSDDIVKRLEALAQRGSQIAPEAPVSEDEPETVVTTNPALADFL